MQPENFTIRGCRSGFHRVSDQLEPVFAVVFERDGCRNRRRQFLAGLRSDFIAVCIRIGFPVKKFANVSALPSPYSELRTFPVACEHRPSLAPLLFSRQD